MEISYQIFGLLILAIVVASISWTVTHEEVFREFREFCERQVERNRSLFEKKFFYVFTCEYCFSHWVSLLIILVTGFRLYIDDWRGAVLAFFALPWLANQMMSIYRRLRVTIKKEDAIAEKVIKEDKK